MSEPLVLLRVAALLGSLALHAGVIGALGLARAATREGYGPTRVDFEVVAPARAPTITPVPAPPEPVTPHAPVARPAPAARPTPEPARTPPGSTDPLAGVTLTGDGPGDGWTSVVGDGSRIDRPVQVPEPAPAPTPDPAPAPAARVAPRRSPEIVPLADLSRRPRPPSLAAALASHYPAYARRHGIEGEAVAAAVVGQDGRVGSARVVSETGEGFGQACLQTLSGSVWSPPLGRDGHPVSTRIRYTCRFRVGR
jgi:TonB family protein